MYKYLTMISSMMSDFPFRGIVLGLLNVIYIHPVQITSKDQDTDKLLISLTKQQRYCSYSSYSHVILAAKFLSLIEI